MLHGIINATSRDNYSDLTNCHSHCFAGGGGGGANKAAKTTNLKRLYFKDIFVCVVFVEVVVVHVWVICIVVVFVVVFFYHDCCCQCHHHHHYHHHLTQPRSFHFAMFMGWHKQNKNSLYIKNIHYKNNIFPSPYASPPLIYFSPKKCPFHTVKIYLLGGINKTNTNEDKIPIFFYGNKLYCVLCVMFQVSSLTCHQSPVLPCLLSNL